MVTNQDIGSDLPITQQIMHYLANGQFHSGQILAHQLGVSRASVWNGIKQLRQCGVEVFSVRGKGYRLSRPVEMLDRDRIIKGLPNSLVKISTPLYLFWQAESTNAFLMGLPDSGRAVCVAESQSRGKGRRGRQWVSPPGGNLYYSHMWEFGSGPEHLGGLSLAAAVTLVDVLVEYGVAGLNLKWPNDVLYRGRKLAGILLELVGEATGPCKVVVGIGLNVHLSGESAKLIDQPWADLSRILDKTINRNQIVAILIARMTSMFQRYEETGVRSFLPRWRELDAFYGMPVRVKIGNTYHLGISQGVDENGNLALLQDGTCRHYASGEVSLRRLESEELEG